MRRSARSSKKLIPAVDFETHYTRDEARALPPSVRKWLKRLVQLKTEMEQRGKRLTP